MNVKGPGVILFMSLNASFGRDSTYSDAVDISGHSKDKGLCLSVFLIRVVFYSLFGL